MFAYLFTGIFIGSLVASVVWGLYLKLAKTQKEYEQKKRDKIMHAVGEYWVEIDSLLASFRSGIMDERSFKNAYTSKMTAINHLLKPNLHLFDVYYVKYSEILIKDYDRRILRKEYPDDSLSIPEFNHEMETNYSPLPQSEQTDLFNSPIDTLLEPETINAADVNQREPSSSMLETNGYSGGTKPESPYTTRHEALPVKSAPEVVSDEVDEMFEEAFSGFDDALTSVTDSGDITITESTEHERDVSDKTELEMPDSFVDQAKTSASGKVSIVNVPPPPTSDKSAEKQTSPLSPFDAALKNSSIPVDEDFSMETLVDVEINTLTPHLQNEDNNLSTTIEKKIATSPFDLLSGEKNTPLSDNDKTELEIVIASDAIHKNNVTPPAVNEITGISEASEPPDAIIGKESSDASSSGARTPENDFEVIIPGKKDSIETSLVIKENTDQIDITISPVSQSENILREETVTGDDVAKKIAALESTQTDIKKKEPDSDNVLASNDNNTSAEKNVSSGKKTLSKKKNKSKRQPSSANKENDSITGEDVANQIDSFFGLFK